MRIAMTTIWVEKPQVLSKWYQDVLDMHVVQETPRFVQLGWNEDDALLAFHVGEPIGNPQLVGERPITCERIPSLTSFGLFSVKVLAPTVSTFDGK